MTTSTLRAWFILVAAGAAMTASSGRPAAAAGTARNLTQATPPQKAPATRSARAVRPTLEIEVTDASGAPIDAVTVRVAGPVERELTTNEGGQASATNLRTGSYRLRFDKEGYVPLEREITIAAGARSARVDVVLTAAPAAPPPPPPPPPPAPPEAERPAGSVASTNVPTFLERNFIGRSEPQKLSVLGCTGYATTRVLQVRDPLPDRVNADADETYYIVAGEATVRIDNKDVPLDAGSLLVVPRGVTHTIARRGRNPVVLVSVLSGPPCPGAQD